MDKLKAIGGMIAAARADIQRGKREGRLTAGTVRKFAGIHMVDDFGAPIIAAAHHAFWLQLFCDERIKKLLIIAPPETAKTTWVLAFVGCYIGFYPENSVIISSVAGAVAEKRSLSLRAMCESAAWQATFTGATLLTAATGFKYTTEEWSLAPNGRPRAGRLHPTVFSVGRGGSVIGSRADLVIADDLLDMDSTRTQAQRKLGEQWIHSSLISRAKSKTGRVIMIGNGWHPEDFYSQMLRDSKGFVVVRMATMSESEGGYFADITYPDDWQHEMLGERVGAAEVK